MKRAETFCGEEVEEITKNVTDSEELMYKCCNDNSKQTILASTATLKISLPLDFEKQNNWVAKTVLS